MTAGSLIACAQAPALELGYFQPSYAGAAGQSLLNLSKADGASWARLAFNWSELAPQRPQNPADPADPAYQWSSLDRALAASNAEGLKSLVTVGFAPAWAQAPGAPASAPPGTWKPDAAAFGAFGRALTLHIRLARLHVEGLQPFNEPNLSTYLTPQWKRTKRGLAPASPAIYRGLLNAFYAGVKAVSPSTQVVAAGTSPFGDDPGLRARRMRPARFFRELLCFRSAALKRAACPHPAHFDVMDHHPYATGGPYAHALNTDDVTVPDLKKLTRPLARAVRYGQVLPRRPKRVWVTEISWDSNPPDPDGVPEARQADWLQRSLKSLSDQGVSVVTWFQIVDSAPTPSYAETYQSGTHFIDGRPKLSATAFRFPLVAARRTAKSVSVWGRAPAAGTLLIERQVGSAFRTVRTQTVGTHSVFNLKVAGRRGDRYRARLAGDTSLVSTAR